MSKHASEDRAESMAQAVEAFVARAQERGAKILEVTEDIVHLIQSAGTTPKERLRLYCQFMQRVREQLGIQKPGRKKKAGSAQH